MVLVTSPRNRQVQEQQRNRIIQLGVVASLLLITVLALVWFSSSSSGTTGQIVSYVRFPSKNRHTQRQQQLDQERKWPPLSDVYDGQKVIADPQFLLDFAILGFEKSGTSTLMKWLGSHPEVECFQEEIYDLYRNRTGSLVWRLHSQLKPGYDIKRGYKSPVDIFNANAIHLLDEYFPKTRVLLALRHPVLYYESLYNFRIQNLPGANDPFISPLDGIGECVENSQGVCTDHSNFAQWMYRLGKTLSLFPTETEQALLKDKPPMFASKAKVTRNPVFVMELSQLIDDDPIRKGQLKTDLKSFLGLTRDLEENPVAVPGKKWPADVQEIKNQRKMNICEEQYVPLREELMRVSRLSSQWIRESFLESDDVFVSSPDFFEQAMLKWMVDPCVQRELKRVMATQ